MSCTVTRTRFPARRTLPCSTVRTPSVFPTVARSAFLFLKAKARGPGRHLESLHGGEGHDHVVGDPVGEELVVGIGAHVGEGQHGNGCLRQARGTRRNIPRPEGLDHHRPGHQAILGRPREQPAHHVAQGRRDGRTDAAHVGWGVDEAARDERLHRRSAEGRLAGKHFVEHAAEREQIAAAVHRISRRLLGTHVGGRAHGHRPGYTWSPRSPRRGQPSMPKSATTA